MRLSCALRTCGLSSRRDFLGVARRLPVAVRHAFAKDSTRNAHRSASYPRKLVVVEVLGLLAGPWFLVRSWAEHRRAR